MVICSTDLFDKGEEMFDKLIEAPDFEHEWFKDWIGSNYENFVYDRSHLDPFVDQQLIQVSHQFGSRMCVSVCVNVEV